MTDAPDPNSALLSALSKLREHTAEINQLASEARFIPPLIPSAPTSRPKTRLPLPVPPPTLSPEQMASRWREGGKSWVATLNRRELNSALRNLEKAVDGQRLCENSPLLSALLSRAETVLSKRRRIECLGYIWFLNYPPIPCVDSALRAACQREPDSTVDTRPRWLRQDWGLDPVSLCRHIGEAVRSQGLVSAQAELGIAPVATSGPWLEPILLSTTPRTVEDIERFLLLADMGLEKRVPAPVTKEIQVFARIAIKLGHRFPETRRRVANLLRGRVGDLFGEAHRARWTGLEQELRTLRLWVTGDILDLVFHHVRPDSMLDHQLEPRRLFWRQYGSWVERLTIFFRGESSEFTSHPEVSRIMGELGHGVISIARMDSPVFRHAVIWMVMRGPAGTPITVIEGNSNCQIRIRAGLHELRRHISYTDSIVHGPLSDDLAFTKRHKGSWDHDVRIELRRYGIEAVR